MTQTGLKYKLSCTLQLLIHLNELGSILNEFKADLSCYLNTISILQSLNMFLLSANSRMIFVKILNMDNNFDPICSLFEKVFRVQVEDTENPADLTNRNETKDELTISEATLIPTLPSNDSGTAPSISASVEPSGSTTNITPQQQQELLPMVVKQDPIDDAKTLLFTNFIETIYSILTFNNDCVYFLKTYSAKINDVLKHVNANRHTKQTQKKIKAINEYIEPCVKIKSYNIEQFNLLCEILVAYEGSIQSLPKQLITVLRIFSHMYQVYYHMSLIRILSLRSMFT
jgi:hypothetical protein